MELTTKQKNALAKKGINRITQLHRWFPIRYIDNTKETGLSKELDEKHAVVIGTLLSCQEKDMRSRRGKYILCKIEDRMSGDYCNVMIFGQIFMYEKYLQWRGKEVIVSGKLQYDPQYGYSLTNIEVFSTDIASNMRMIPVFSKIKGITADTLEQMVKESLAVREKETIDPEILDKYGLLGINEALSSKLFPKDKESLLEADKRLLFDDIYYLAGKMELSIRHIKEEGIRIEKTEETDRIKKALPYQLTDGQESVYETMREKLLNGRHLKALIQGDVGCGKTITAFLTMLLLAENGHQAVMMAPTKILAKQHYEKLCELTEGSGLSTALLSSSLKRSELKRIKNGDVKLIIGTHALFSDKVVFRNLGLIVIDEEHKFGVEQRKALKDKQKNTNSISMSATPIPRTMAKAIYGNDTEVFSIRDMPKGRKPIVTKYAKGSEIKSYVEQVLKRREQVYAVCLAIDEENEGQMLSTEKAAKVYRKLFPEKVIEELTGEFSKDKTDRILDDFKDGKIDILVSTTVVEVGVDVGNATMMVIHDAERFGLAALHQLRGRVGRSEKQSCCILVSKQNPLENERIRTMCEVSDGFEIARRDMQFLRKTGDLFGVEQSGFNKYVEEMLMYPKLYEATKKIVQDIPDKELSFHAEKVLMSEVKRHMKPIVLINKRQTS